MKQFRILNQTCLFFIFILSLSAFNVAEAKKITITLGTYDDFKYVFHEIFRSKSFKAKFPNVTVKVKSASFKKHHHNLIRTLKGKINAADIETIALSHLSEASETNALLNIGKSLEVLGFSTHIETKNLAPGFVSLAKVNNKLIAAPFSVAPILFYWRNDIADEHGVELSNIADHCEYIEKAKQLTVDLTGNGKNDQFALPSMIEFVLLQLNGGYGGWFKKGVPYEPKEKFLRALEIAEEIKDAGISAALKPWKSKWKGSFNRNLAVTCVGPVSLGSDFKNELCPSLSGSWRISNPPGNIAAAGEGCFLSIPKQTEYIKRDLCIKIIRFLLSPDAQSLLNSNINRFPALTDLYSQPFVSQPIEYFGGQKIFLSVKDLVKRVPVIEVTKQDHKARQYFIEAVKKIETGKMNSKKAISWLKSRYISPH
jgi:ABC-type glycerol-3-phosphate transport system substrate-binding protein